jgi:D-alanine-D-alanine ligase
MQVFQPTSGKRLNLRNLLVTVLLGGPSSEREVSIRSGGAVAAACRRLGHTVTEADINPEDLSALDIPADLVFPVLHGEFGEDGKLQGLLEKRQILYVGSDAAASRMGMDKDACKQAWHAGGLPTAGWICATAETSKDEFMKVEPPFVVKPNAEGSSIGVRFAKDRDELARVLDDEIPKRRRVIIERQLDGPDLTVGILGRQPLPILKIQPSTPYLSFEAKYDRNDTQYLFELGISDEIYRSIQQIALSAFDRVGARDLARVDLMLDKQIGPQLLEINTMPGFTQRSLFPKAAAQAGMTFDQTINRLIELALARE